MSFKYVYVFIYLCIWYETWKIAQKNETYGVKFVGWPKKVENGNKYCNILPQYCQFLNFVFLENVNFQNLLHMLKHLESVQTMLHMVWKLMGYWKMLHMVWKY